MKFEADDWFSTVYYCYECPRGHYMNATSPTCQECPVGFFQDDEGMTECEPCPEFHSTLQSGSTKQSQCLSQCVAGHFSITGLNSPGDPCQPCPLGTYNDVNGSSECETCPQGTTTLSIGSDSRSRCVGAPKIDYVMPKAQVPGQLGNALNLACIFKGTILPDPTRIWSKDSGSIPASAIQKDILTYDRSVIGMILMIPKATSSDAGTYRCTVRNQLGSDSRSFRVTLS